MAPVTDVRDLRVLIPQARRAIDGPTATGSAAATATLDDGQILGVVADATAEVILLTGGFFGYQLEVTERDPDYLAPIAWQTDKERDSNADTVIVMQAAIDYHFRRLSELKTSEEISDEGQTWTYSISAQALRDYLKLLSEQRDKALAAIQATGAPLDTYVSFVHARDLATARLTEPWVDQLGGVGGQAYMGLMAP